MKRKKSPYAFMQRFAATPPHAADSGNPIGLFAVIVFDGTHVLTNVLHPDIAAFTHGKSAGKVVGAVFEASFPT
jgi:hypothetical protein|tara:strand:- start:5956 stop:6177 length:222 start_codon:yes stop_codon:yes gene_type:complete